MDFPRASARINARALGGRISRPGTSQAVEFSARKLGRAPFLAPAYSIARLYASRSFAGAPFSPAPGPLNGRYFRPSLSVH